MKDIITAVHTSLRRIAPRGYCIALNISSDEGEQPAFLHIDYPDEWREIYFNENLILDDPTVKFARENIGVVTWHDLKLQHPQSKTFQISKQFGISQGVTIAKIISGHRCAISLTASNLTFQARAEIEKFLKILHFVYCFPKPVLTPRQRQVVQCMADGLRDREISKNLKIKPETVRYRRISAYKATSTQTPAELIAAAIRSGDID